MCFGDLNTQFANRIAYMRLRGFDVRVMWECQWNQMREEMETATMLKEIYEYIPDGQHINPQDALFGGRTDASSILFPGPQERPKVQARIQGR